MTPSCGCLIETAAAQGAPPDRLLRSRCPRTGRPRRRCAVFECLELLRDQLWLAYGPDIQRAWRGQLAPQQLTLPIDPSDPF